VKQDTLGKNVFDSLSRSKGVDNRLDNVFLYQNSCNPKAEISGAKQSKKMAK